MLGLFGKSRFLDADLEDWFLETWAWLMSKSGGMDRMHNTPLVTPTRDFFPPTEAVGHEKALHVFECVKSLMGLQAWDCDLVAKTRATSQRVDEYLFVNGGGGAAGTFQVRDGRVTITYASDLVDHPMALVSTLAHELAHYRLAILGEHGPGGQEAHELATELAVAHAGFAVFSANSAFDFSRHSDGMGQGWRTSRSGYFSDRTWAFALALFLTLRGEEGLADRWVKPIIKDMMKSATKYLDKRPELLAPLRAST
jgi:hypothetical protein